MDYKLYLEGPCEGRLGMSTFYTYEDDVLEIRWCGERQWHCLPSPSAVIVKCEGCAPEVVPMEWPKVFRWRVMWLCGVKKQNRCATMVEYDEVCKKYDPDKLRHVGGNGWQIALHTGRGGREHAVAAWINGRMSNEEVRKMVSASGTTAPEWFRKQVLGF